jgi:glycosyltransferase involved in cell wall biosynthesis
MRIGFISTRLNGADGVSLEVEKWANVLHRLGHELFYCARELGGYCAGGCLIPLLHFERQSTLAFTQRAFRENASKRDAEKLVDEIYEVADEIRAPLRRFIRSHHLDLIIVENALTSPMNLPLGISLIGLIAELGIHTIAHDHDFYWEHQHYQSNNLLGLLDTTFPARLPTIQHVTTNAVAQRRLKDRQGIDALVIPNVYDFVTPPPGIDGYNCDFRQVLGLSRDDLFILQPTRVMPRKGIELALKLVQRLGLPNPRLFITHRPYDDGLEYWRWLKREASLMEIDLQLIDHLIAPERTKMNGPKIYSPRDVYPHADLITYPSDYEGFGNALLELVYFKRLGVVNRYPVYRADIQPIGFDFIELDGFVAEETVQRTQELLHNSEQVKAMTEKNYALAQEHFSLEVLERKLHEVLVAFRS